MALTLKILLGLIVLMAVGIWLYLKLPQFVDPVVDTEKLTTGKAATPSPTGEVQYEGEHFHNLEATSVMSQPSTTDQNNGQKSSGGLFSALYKFLFEPVPNGVPAIPLPSRKTDLASLSRNENLVIWMGHSTYYLQVNGLRILIDPVFSKYASPVPGTNRAFDGTNIYTTEEIPELDYLLISHDHWDHLDYPTLKGLKNKVKQVVVPLGVASYFEQWGWPKEQLFEGKWGEHFAGDDIEIHILPARHFSGRLLERNRTLWGSFALVTPNQKIYLSGDTGYGQHFKAIGEQFGPFDLAVLECGQYNPAWATIHMMPEETAQAANDLQAATVLAAHNSKFKLSRHPWDEPLNRIQQASQGQTWKLLTPLIGEQVNLGDDTQVFSDWWKQAGLKESD